jgi:hypothetical protein
MANDQDFTLVFRIKANAAQARTELKKLNADLGHFTGNGIGGQLARGSRMGFGLAGSTGRAAVAPLRLATRYTSILAAGTIGLGVAASNAAADYEALRLRLEAMTGSADRANEIFGNIVPFSARTPMRLDELVDARIILEGVGVSGMKALEGVADASAGMGRGIRDVALGVASLETEPLRRLGIEMRRAGEVAEFDFKDRLGKWQHVTASGTANIRESLVDIFEVKFSGSTSRLAKAMHGLRSTLLDVVKRSFAAVGDGINGPMKKAFSGIIETGNQFVEGGEAEALGKRIGEALDTGMDSALAAFKTLQEFRQFLSENPGTGAEAFRITASGMAEMFANSLIGYIGAMAGVFAGIGGIIWSAFAEELYSSNLPGLRGARKASAKDAVGRMSAADLRSEVKGLIEGMKEWRVSGAIGAAGGDYDDFNSGRVAEGMDSAMKRLKPATLRNMLNTRIDSMSYTDESKEWEKHLALLNRKSDFMAALNQTRNAIPDELKATAVLNKAVMDRMSNELGGLGFSPKASYAENLQAVRNPTPAAVPTTYGPQSHMQVGDASGKPIIIQIGRLIVQATDSGDVARGIIAEAGRYGRLPMGAF